MERSEVPVPRVTGTTARTGAVGSAAARVFLGDSEMAARCRAFDWSTTRLGPVEEWPQSLCTAATIVTGAGFPMILVWGPELVQIYNDAYIPLIGQKHPKALGMPTHECWPELRSIQEPIFERVFNGETVRITEARYPLNRHGTAENAYFDGTFAPVPLEDGRIGGSISALAETTDRAISRRRTAELSAVIESMPDAVLIGTPEGMTLVNRQALLQLGVESIDALRGPPQNLITLANGRDASTGEPILPGSSPIARALRGEAVVQELVIRPRGTEKDRFLRVAAGPIEIEGEIVAAVSVNTDITEQVEATRAIAAANQAKSEFLAMMSHELRTPLNAIGGYVELLQMGVHGPTTPEQRSALERIQRSQRHLLGLINQVLNFARVEAGVVHYEIADVAAAEILTTCEMLIAPQITSKGIVYEMTPCEPGVAVRTDREKAQQILLNVLSNAVKFTDSGGRIDVRCSATDTTVSMAVSDTGRGIAADQLENIFQPFVQVDVKLNRSREGVGLGLAISRDLAQGMGGELSAQSKPGVGSTFTLTLPRAGRSGT